MCSSLVPLFVARRGCDTAQEQAANGKALDPSQKEKLVSAAQTSQEILEMETALRSLQLSAGL